MTPPADQDLLPGGTPAPQPRVYGRPARPEPADEPEPAQEHGLHPDQNPPPRFGDPGPQGHFGEREPQGHFDGPGRPNQFGERGPQGQFDQPGPQGQFDQPGPQGQFDQPGPQGQFDQPGPQGHFDQRGSQGHFGEPGPQGPFGERGPQNQFGEPGSPQGFGDQGPQGFGPPAQQHGYGDGPAAGASVSAPPAFPPAFPPGMPSFTDPPASNRPVNGVRPHDADRPGDQFGGPAAPGGGVGAQGHGPNPFDDQAFPQGQQSASSWDAGPDQGRFDSFKPEAAEEKKPEPPAPKVRNGRVLAAVLVAAVLILAVPLGLLMLLGKVGADETPAFDPAVGSCVKRSGDSAAAATCGEAGSFTVVSKVATKEKCADPAQPYISLPGDVQNKVLCLKPSGK